MDEIIIIIQCGRLISLENSQNTTNKMERFSDSFISVRRSTCFRLAASNSNGLTNA